MAGRSGRAEDAHARRADGWRLKVLNHGSAGLAVLSILIMVAMWGQPVFEEEPGVSVGVIGGYVIAVAWIGAAVWRRGPYVVRALMVLCGFLLVEALGLSRAGYGVGPVLAGVCAVVGSGLLLGVRWTIATWVVSTGIMLGGAVLLGRGIIPSHFEARFVDPTDLMVGLRLSAVFALYTLFLAVGVSVVIQRLGASLSETQKVLADLEAEQAGRAHAEAKRRDAEEAVRVAQKLQLIGGLASGIAHDFHNCLQVIVGWNGLMKMKSWPEKERRAAIESIDDACQHATRLTQQLLTLGRQELRSPKPHRLEQIVERFGESLRRLIPSDIELGIAVEDSPPVLVDEVQIQQVLLNLAVNARDAMDGKGGKLSIFVGPGPDKSVELVVADTGSGMDEQTLARVFDPFFTTKEEGKGTGLGLATVRRIVEQHGGTIEAQSELGEGATFRILLPSHVGEAEERPSAADAAHARKPATVLVVDDDRWVRNVLEQMLLSVGHRVLVAANGDQAVEQIERHAPEIDLLCCDAVMPGIPAREIIQTFEARCPNGKTLVCSAHVEEELLRRGIETRSWAHLAKPFKPEQLLAATDELLA